MLRSGVGQEFLRPPGLWSAAALDGLRRGFALGRGVGRGRGCGRPTIGHWRALAFTLSGAVRR